MAKARCYTVKIYKRSNGSRIGLKGRLTTWAQAVGACRAAQEKGIRCKVRCDGKARPKHRNRILDTRWD